MERARLQLRKTRSRLPERLRLIRQRTETEALLASQHDEEDQADSDGLYPPNCTWTSNQKPPRGADLFDTGSCNVWENIIRIRRDMMSSIDDPYSLEQLKSPRMNVSVVRPLVDALYERQDLSIVYCLLVNRMQFIREQSSYPHHQTVNLTRALLCELVAEKVLRRYNEHNPGPRGLLKLANILVAGFDPFQGAPEEVCAHSSHAMHWATQNRAGQVDRKLTALEVAILSASKSFLASSASQKVVDAIYRGKVIYTPSSFIDILPDHWKKRPISLYDPRKAPLLNQYRLIVPRTRNGIEVCQFVILLGLYCAVMVGRESRMTTEYTNVEMVFQIYGFGWVLDQIASILEHGWGVYTQNLWSFLDVMFAVLFLVYAVLRLHAFAIAENATDSMLWARNALDVLSCCAPVLIPRLAFNFMSENMLFLSLRAMMTDFLTLTILAVWCFAGFLFSLKWLHNGAHHSVTIAEWMIWIWFGLDGTGIDEAPDFHWFFGPVLMILFAFLGNTLFLTILVSMLTNTFSAIAGNAVQEIQFRRAVLTFEGVKSDSIFAYMPPFNILALIIMLPLKLITSPRMFHKINVAVVRGLNAPLLLLISWYERRTLWMANKRKAVARLIDWKHPNGPSYTAANYWSISRFSVHGDIQAVFQIEPPQSVLDRMAEEDEGIDSDGAARPWVNALNESFENGGGSRRNSHVPNHDKRPSLSFRPAKKRRESKASDETTEAIRKEFFDSSASADDTEGLPQVDRLKGYMKHPTRKRMDSLADLNDNPNPQMQEASERLHKMEEAIARMEAMLSQLVSEDASDIKSEGAREVENEVQQHRSG